MPVFDEEGLGYLGPRPDCWLTRENNGESRLEKVALAHMMGWPFVGKGFFRDPEESDDLSPSPLPHHLKDHTNCPL